MNLRDETLLACRQLAGWTMEEATRPIEKEVFEFEGEKRTLYEWCGLMGLHHEDTYLRIIRGDYLAHIINGTTMKTLVLKPGSEYAEDELPSDEDWDWKENKPDCEKIIEICKLHGYKIDLLTAYNAWTEHSMDYCASWLNIDGDGAVLERILKWCDIVENK